LHGTLKATWKTTLKNLLDDGSTSATATHSYSLLNKTLTYGIADGKATRAWQVKSRSISSGNTEDIDLYDYATVDLGAGLRRDGIGQLAAYKQVVGFIIKCASGAGSLEVMPANPSNHVAWMPSLTVANGGALRSGATMALIQPKSTAFTITDASSHMLRLGANGGAVSYNLYVLARHYG
jgi:hypothetical protein